MTQLAVWRNGSASDYESGGCSFEYYLGHFFFSALTRYSGVFGFGLERPHFVILSLSLLFACSSAPRRGR